MKLKIIASRKAILYFDDYKQMHFTCPLCGHYNIHPTYPEDEAYNCSLCGTDFDATTGEVCD